MQFPDLGKLTKDQELDWYYTQPMTVPFLGKNCRFILTGYDEDTAPKDMLTAIENFLSLDESVLKPAEPHVFQYYLDCNSQFHPADEGYPKIASPEDVWRYVRFGAEPLIARRRSDNRIYISLECGCDWEEEHGLQIVFKNGVEINKVGEYDGHLTNSDAFDRPEFEAFIYVKIADILPKP